MESISLNIADWIILTIIAASSLMSLSRGFTKEFLSLFLWIIAFLAALKFEKYATLEILKYVNNEDISTVLSYIVIFITVFILGKLIIRFVSQFVKWSASFFDRFFGVVFGFLRGYALILIIFIFIPETYKTADFFEDSKILPIIKNHAPKLESYFYDLINEENQSDLTEPMFEMEISLRNSN